MKPAVLDRSPQNLPVPLGGLSPVRRRPPLLRRALRRHRAGLLVVAGVTLAGTGAVLAFSAPSTAVYLKADVLRIGRYELRGSGAGTGVRVFTGAVTVAVTQPVSGEERGAGVSGTDGVRVLGACDLRTSQLRARETCTFSTATGQTLLTATDTFDVASRSWLRRYSDGVTVTFTVPPDGQLVPIPLPLGHG